MHWHVLSSDEVVWGEQGFKTRFSECDFIEVGLQPHLDKGYRDIISDHQRFIAIYVFNEELCEIIVE